MPRKTLAPVLLGILMISLLANAQTMGVGGRLDMLSSGIELRFAVPVGNAQLFIAPNGLGAYYFGDSTGSGFYSVGLRTGVMFAPKEWISPYIGLGGGYSFNSSSSSYPYDYVRDSLYDFVSARYENLLYGGRVFAGLSFAPFQMLSEDVKWLKPLNNLRFEFDSGFLYKFYSDHTVEIWEDSLGVEQTFDTTVAGQGFTFPDFGVGVVFMW